jgi:hypothetical protein
MRILQAVLGVAVLAAIGVAVWFFMSGGGAADWEEFTSPEGAFKVSLPGQPKTSTKTLATAEGPVTQHLFTVERPRFREAFVVGYVDYPAKMVQPGAERIIDGELAMLHDSPKPARRKERTSARAISPGVFAGQVNLVTVKEGTIRVKAIMVKQRLFTLMVRSPHDEASEELANKLFDSFAIVGQVPDLLRPKGATAAFSGHTEPIDGLAFSAQGDKLTTVARDGTLRVWEYPSGKEVAFANLREDFRTPNAVAFAPDGNTLAVGLGGPGEKLLLWDLAGRSVKAQTRAPGSATLLAFTADGKHLIFAAGTGSSASTPSNPTSGRNLPSECARWLPPTAGGCTSRGATSCRASTWPR